jgi:hypothetical protein
MKSIVKTTYSRSISVVMVFAIAGTIVITAGALRCTIVSAQSGTNIPSTYFGMHTTDPVGAWPSVSMGALGKGNNVTWSFVESTKGVFDWSHVDLFVNAAQSHGIDIFYSFNRVPPWAAANQSSCNTINGVARCSSMVGNIQDWDDYVTALVSRYKGKFIYELWNEPDASTFTGTVTDMVTLTTHAYNIIRSIDPGALILAPSPTASGAGWMDQYFAAGGPTGIDVVTFHSYHSAPELKINDINKMKNVMAKYNLSSKPLWDTEGSWGTFALTSDQQVGYVARDHMLQWSQGVSRYYWYGWNEAGYGPLFVSGAPTIAATAYQQVYNWMVGATMSSPCTMAPDSTWTCTLTRPGGYQALAVWNSATTTSYTPASQYKQYLDLAGHSNSIQGAVTIGYNPILLVSSAPPAPPTNVTIFVQ